VTENFAPQRFSNAWWCWDGSLGCAVVCSTRVNAFECGLPVAPCSHHSGSKGGQISDGVRRAATAAGLSKKLDGPATAAGGLPTLLLHHSLSTGSFDGDLDDDTQDTGPVDLASLAAPPPRKKDTAYLRARGLQSPWRIKTEELLNRVDVLADSSRRHVQQAGVPPR
jgi:hypothetical protein